MSAPSTGVPLHQWPGSSATIYGGGISSAGLDFDDNRSFYFGQNSQRGHHQSVPHLRIVTDFVDSPGGTRSTMSQSSMSRGWAEDNAADELNQALRRHNLHHQAEIESDNIVPGDDLSRQREEKRLEIEQMIRECRETGLNFARKENEDELVESPTQDQGRNARQYGALAFH
ncbi:hypothetical protein BGW39_004406 [Mortierella sp. 14UC]|nr:hypothetical protein BGW39_004406 [Mortierella sp. 14UC]